MCVCGGGGGGSGYLSLKAHDVCPAHVAKCLSGGRLLDSYHRFFSIVPIGWAAQNII